MKRAGKWLTVLGGVVLVGAIVVGTLLAVGGFRQMMNFDEESIPVASAAGGTYRVEHHFDQGQKIALYTYGANGVYVGPVPRCEITGPAPVRAGGKVTSSVTIGQQSRISFASYVIDVAGTYRVTCDSAGVTIAPPLSGTGIVSGAVGIFAAIFGGMVGMFTLLAGVALWVVGARRPPAGPGSTEPRP